MSEPILIDIGLLEEETLERRKALICERESEIRERWRLLLTSEYIRETIKTHMEKNMDSFDSRRIYLIDEVHEPSKWSGDTLEDINMSRIMEEIPPPFKYSLRQEIDMRVDTKTARICYGKTLFRLCVVIDDRNPYLRYIDLNPADKHSSGELICAYSCFASCFCCFFCCKVC